jgi:predicted HTH transcriptional regulator
MATTDNMVSLKHYLAAKIAAINEPVNHSDLLKQTGSVIGDATTFHRVIDNLIAENIIEKAPNYGKGVWYKLKNLGIDSNDLLDLDGHSPLEN